MAQPDQAWCFFYNQCAQSLDDPQSGDRYEVLQNGDDPYQSYFDTELHTVNASYKLSDANEIEYVFGYFTTDEKVYQDWDGTALTLYHTDRPADWNQRSHELRWTHTGDRLSYTLGAYYWDSDYRIDLTSYIGFGDLLFGLPSGTVLTVLQTVAQTTESKALFFEGDYKFTDALTLTVGGRYTEDEKTSGVIDPIMPELAVKGSLENPFENSWSEFTPKVACAIASTRPPHGLRLYSKGFRAGGFNGRPGTYEAASIPYDPETVDNYELGIKSEWLDGRLRLNGSVFYMNYDDKQEEQSVPTSQGTGQQTVVVNASSAEIYGLEIDLAAAITERFMLTANLGILDASYKELIDRSRHRSVRFRPATGPAGQPRCRRLRSTWDRQVLGAADIRYIGEQELTFRTLRKATSMRTRFATLRSALKIGQLDSESGGQT
jgi:iron complex outermembrane receptor protein